MEVNVRENKVYIASVILVFAVLCIAASAFVYGKLATYHVQAQVVEMLWRRVIRVEKYQMVQEDSLRSGVPADAYNISYYTRTWYESQTCSRSVYGGTDSKGRAKYRNESYECGTWRSESRAKYTVNRWRYDHDLQTQGSPGKERVWPEFVPSAVTELGALREGSREEFLTVTLQANELTLTYRAPSDVVWLTYAVQQSYEMDVNRWNEPLWETIRLVDRR